MPPAPRPLAPARRPPAPAGRTPASWQPAGQPPGLLQTPLGVPASLPARGRSWQPLSPQVHRENTRRGPSEGDWFRNRPSTTRCMGDVTEGRGDVTEGGGDVTEGRGDVSGGGHPPRMRGRVGGGDGSVGLRSAGALLPLPRGGPLGRWRVLPRGEGWPSARTDSGWLPPALAAETPAPGREKKKRGSEQRPRAIRERRLWLAASVLAAQSPAPGSKEKGQ